MIPWSSTPPRGQCGKPRASGDDPAVDGGAHDLLEVNPARAGMILAVIVFVAACIGKPRASGDDPVPVTDGASREG